MSMWKGAYGLRRRRSKSLRERTVAVAQWQEVALHFALVQEKRQQSELSHAFS